LLIDADYCLRRFAAASAYDVSSSSIIAAFRYMLDACR